MCPIGQFFFRWLESGVSFLFHELTGLCWLFSLQGGLYWGLPLLPWGRAFGGDGTTNLWPPGEYHMKIEMYWFCLEFPQEISLMGFQLGNGLSAAPLLQVKAPSTHLSVLVTELCSFCFL